MQNTVFPWLRMRYLLPIVLCLSCTHQSLTNTRFFENQLATADAVARIIVLEEYGGSSYHFVRAKVVFAYKNATKYPLPPVIGISFLGAKNARMTEGMECTAYLLLDLSDDEKGHWSLDESDLSATEERLGYSHVVEPDKAKRSN